MRRARFSREARDELLAQVAFYEELRHGLGARFRSEVETAAALAVTFPLHGKPGPARTRRRLVADFPFKLFCSQTEYGILVHAVADDRQRPEYWLHRITGNE